MAGRTAKVLVHRLAGGRLGRAPDEVVVEEPLEIRLDGHLVTTTMRTPGHDHELAAGFCWTEGLLGGAAVQRCRSCAVGPPEDRRWNVVHVETGGRAPVPEARLTTTTSSCGLCGAASLDAVRRRLHPLPAPRRFDLDVLAAAPAALRSAQDLFSSTGGVHAAGAFTAGGDLVVVREDVGRHNAVDKVVGRLLLAHRMDDARDLGLVVSGRASFEIVQKAWAAGFPAVVAVSAPSSLAVETARVAGLMLAGFAREGRLNVYAPEDVRR
ncbi:MAG TPA: formate dehydrogenase accessory sulfurtransferase FdhD [Acidimicrobiales bacterium]|jgi:FdhD protein